jgi:hypothetical protein
MGRSTSTSASKNDLLIPVLVGVLVFLMAARTPLDSDLFWHLRAGETTLSTLRPVLSDTMSYTRAGAVWVNHSWLGQVFLAILYNLGGYLALSAWVACAAAAMMLGAYGLMSGPALWRAFVVILACLVIAPLWTARPQLFSLLLLVGLEAFLVRWRAGRAHLAWVVPLFVVWSNLHGGYPLGLILIACWIAGELLNHLTGQEGALPTRRLLHLALAGLAGWLAVALNPNGIAMWGIPFQTLGVNVLQRAIPEWASPDFHDLAQQPFLWMLAAILGAFGLSGQRVEGKALLKVVVFAAMGLVARRNFGPFALLAAPVLSESGWQVLGRITARLPEGFGEGKPVSSSFRRVFNLGIIAFLALAAGGKVVAVSHPALVESYLRQEYPTEAVSWLKQARPAGRLFSSYAWGGYLDWALPEYPVFVDGRTDLFGDAVIHDWMQVDNVGSGWEEILQRWQVSLVLLEPTHPLLKELEHAGWHVLFRNPSAVIYAK